MNTLTIRKVPDEIHRALRMRAAKNGRSAEAEVRAILESVIAPLPNIGDALFAIGRTLGGVNIDFVRDKRPYKIKAF